jgi:hypothetical protein
VIDHTSYILLKNEVDAQSIVRTSMMNNGTTEQQRQQQWNPHSILAIRPVMLTLSNGETRSELLESSQQVGQIQPSSSATSLKRRSSSFNEEPPRKRQSFSFSATLTRDDSLSTKLESAINSENEDEDILTEEKESKGQQWFFCQPTSTSTSLFWKHFDMFDTTKHPDKKDKAACKYCFAISRFKRGTVACKGGSTSGLKRHIESHHQKEFEESMNKLSSTRTASTILKHLNSFGRRHR